MLKNTAKAMGTHQLPSFPNTMNNAFSNLLMKGNNFTLRQPRLQFESLCNNNGVNYLYTREKQQHNQQVSIGNGLAVSEPIAKTTGTSSVIPLTQTMIQTKEIFEKMPGKLFQTGGIEMTSTTITTTKTNATADIVCNDSSIVTCAVCAFPIHEKSITQASKYGQLSCEFCRKFISKIARKALSLKHQTMQLSSKFGPLQCKRNGNSIL